MALTLPVCRRGAINIISMAPQHMAMHWNVKLFMVNEINDNLRIIWDYRRCTWMCTIHIYNYVCNTHSQLNDTADETHSRIHQTQTHEQNACKYNYNIINAAHAGACHGPVVVVAVRIAAIHQRRPQPHNLISINGDAAAAAAAAAAALPLWTGFCTSGCFLCVRRSAMRRPRWTRVRMVNLFACVLCGWAVWGVRCAVCSNCWWWLSVCACIDLGCGAFVRVCVCMFVCGWHLRITHTRTRTEMRRKKTHANAAMNSISSVLLAYVAIGLIK